ncbi:hypothetical protein [Kitasatospora sp. NPDC056789]|uniref:hypothetical protein n=1 Tax=Kitasatospora sp. NPDC056789 TaxID=3345945 RepID=UPI00367FA9B8
MFTPETKLRGPAVAAALAATLVGLGAGTADAAGWPPLQPGARLYSSTYGQGFATTVDLTDLGTCHTLWPGARSVQIANGGTTLALYAEADCNGPGWLSGTLAQANLPRTALSSGVLQA